MSSSRMRHFVRKGVICGRVNFKARLDRHSLVVQGALQVWVVERGARPLDSFSHWQEAPIWENLRWVGVLALSGAAAAIWSVSAVRGSRHGQITVDRHTRPTVERIVNTVVHESALTDGWHKACVALRHCRLIV